MPESAYDCIVIGSGPGGYVAAIRAAQLGMKTAVVEKDVVGGRCLNYACIPAKAVLRVADILSEIDEASDFGITVPERTIDFGAVGERRRRSSRRSPAASAGLMKKNKIDVHRGRGRADAAAARCASATSESRRKTVVLATGSVPKPIPGTEFGGRVIGTEEAWALEQLPETLAVSARAPRAPRSPPPTAAWAPRCCCSRRSTACCRRRTPTSPRSPAARCASRTSQIHTGTLVENVQDRRRRGVVPLRRRAGRGRLARHRGRARARTSRALGLDAAGVELDDHGLVAVDGRQRTSADGVYAIGDLVRGPALAHKSSDEGIIAVEDAAGLETHPLEYPDIPRATFCTPNVASFGLTEEQAREQGLDIVVGKLQYGAVGAGTVYGDRGGVIKIIGDKQYGELVGGHIVGAKAVDLIQELVNAKALEGGYPEVARIVHGHPTFSEAVMEAARAADGWLIHG